MISPCGHGDLTCETCAWSDGRPVENPSPPPELVKPTQAVIGGIKVIVNPYMPASERALLLCSQAFFDDLMGETDPVQRVTEIVEGLKGLGLDAT